MSLRDYSLYLNYGEVALLPDEHSLVLNVHTGHYVVVNWNVRFVKADGQFSPVGELPLMCALLDAWPSYVPTALLLQAVTGRSAEEIAELLEIALHDGALEPLHSHLEACRERLHAIGLDIEAQPAVSLNQPGPGYKLSRMQQQRGGHS